MEICKIPRIMLVGTGSGCGKTTITCGLLAAYKARGLNIAAFKCGPDYIDPMFHKEALGVNSYNLDVILTKEEGVSHILGQGGKNHHLSIIEGVMGMYDGQGLTDIGSSNHISQLTNTQQILVVSPKGVGLSIAAIVSGYKEFKENNLVGVIINNTNENMYAYYKKIIEQYTGLNVLGYLPKNEEISIESRHLGLVTAGEIENIKEKLENLGKICEQTIDLDKILEIAKEKAIFSYEKINIQSPINDKVKIALAWDEAFCFYYQDSLKVLENMGAEIIKFSPIKDRALPKNIGGLILPGGYPELYAKELETNESMKSSIKEAIENGLPTIAECGGYMYLCESLEDLQGKKYLMVGTINHKAKMTGKLVRFGYGVLEAKENGLLADKGEVLLAHEFHYSDTDNNGEAFLFKRARGENLCAVVNKNLYAAYPHIHFLGNIQGAKRFVKAAKAWEE